MEIPDFKSINFSFDPSSDKHYAINLPSGLHLYRFEIYLINMDGKDRPHPEYEQFIQQNLKNWMFRKGTSDYPYGKTVSLYYVYAESERRVEEILNDRDFKKFWR